MYYSYQRLCNREPTFAITDTKLYVPVVILSPRDNEKLLQQLKTGFRKTFNRNEYQSELTIQTQNRNLNHLIDPSFQGVNRLFVLSFENDAYRRSYNRYFFPTIEMKYFNVMIDGKNFFDQPIKNDLITDENTQKIATGQGR